MKLIKIKTSAGVEVLFNTDQVIYLRTDPLDEKRTIIFTAKDPLIVNGNLETVIELLKGK